MAVQIQFKPIAHSWVALHPKPKGVIHFIGGAFFGTFAPMLFYRHLLQYFFDLSYTVVLLPFDFTFNHYREAGLLAKEQYQILPDMVRTAILSGYDYQIYLSERNYTWIGHSLGCKYVALLEGLSALPQDKDARSEFIRDLLLSQSNPASKNEIQLTIGQVDNLFEELRKEISNAEILIHQYVKDRFGDDSEQLELDFSDLFIKNQPSILLAPDISDTASAIRPGYLAAIVDRLGLGVKPTPEVTHKLIRRSNLFNLLGLACFQDDDIASETCHWFTQDLQKPPSNDQRCLHGGHLRPLGVRLGNWVLNLFLDRPWIATVDNRNAELESPVSQLLEVLQARVH